MATVHTVTEQELPFGIYTSANARPHVHIHNKDHMGEACVKIGTHTDVCILQVT